MLEWTPAGVLTIFENRRGAGVDFFKEGPEPEWIRSQFFNKRLLCLFTGQQMFGLVFFIFIFWCFLMFFGALSPKMTLFFS